MTPTHECDEQRLLRGESRSKRFLVSVLTPLIPRRNDFVAQSRISAILIMLCITVFCAGVNSAILTAWFGMRFFRPWYSFPFEVATGSLVLALVYGAVVAVAIATYRRVAAPPLLGDIVDVRDRLRFAIRVWAFAATKTAMPLITLGGIDAINRASWNNWVVLSGHYSGPTIWLIRLNEWCTVPLLLLIPVCGVASAIRPVLGTYREHLQDRCRKCGYLLSGLAPNAVCPECGEDAVAAQPWDLRLHRWGGWVYAMAAGLILSAVTTHISFVPWTLGQRHYLVNPNAFGIATNEVAVVSKDGAIGEVRLSRVSLHSWKYESKYWGTESAWKTRPAEAINVGVLLEPRATRITVGPWTVSWSIGGWESSWIYRPDRTFDVERQARSE